jgi:hypothetical protein
MILEARKSDPVEPPSSPPGAAPAAADATPAGYREARP